MEKHGKFYIRRMTINIGFYLLIILLISCNHDNSLVDSIYCSNDEYWELSNAKEGFRGIYVRFNKDHTSDRFRVVENKMVLYNSDGDVIYDRKKWSLSSDSIMKWGMHKADLVKLDSNTMILYYPNDVYVVLVKVKENKLLRGRGFYEQKRLKYPEKYLP